MSAISFVERASSSFQTPSIELQRKNNSIFSLSAHAAAKRLRGQPPSWKGMGMPAAGLAADGIQIARIIGSAMEQIGPENTLITNTGFLTGSIWSVMGINELFNGAEDLEKANEIADGEGRRRAQGRLLSASILTGGSLLYLGGKTVDFFQAGEAIGTGLQTAAEHVFGVGSIVSMGIAGLGLYRCYKFRDRINQRLENPLVASEARRCFDALSYLKETMSLTGKEISQIVESVGREDLPAAEKGMKIAQKIYDRTEVKMKYFKRRTSQKALNMVLTRVEPILAKLSNPALESEGIAEAKKLIGDVKKENSKKARLYIVAMIAAAIAFAAFIAGTFFSCGALPLILMLISTAIYFSMAAYALYQQVRQKTGVLNDSNLPPPVLGSIAN